MRRAVLLLIALCLPALLSGCFRRRQPTTTSHGAAPPGVASYPEDPSFQRSPDELEAFIARETEGYAPAGPPVEAQLDGFQPWAVQLERGQCYRMVLRLAPGASFSEHARRGVAFVYVAPGEPEVHGGPGVHGPGAVVSAGCPQRSHTATFDMRANFGSATDRSRIHDLGHGKLTAQLFSKPITEEELAALEADRQRQLAESEEFGREMRAREAEAAARREAEWAARRDEEEARRRQAATSGSAAPAHSGPVSVTLRNGCRQTVPLFFGDNPPFSGGTYSSLSSNTVTSRSFREGETIWIVDDNRRGVSSVTVSRNVRTIEITPSCSGLTSR